MPSHSLRHGGDLHLGGHHAGRSQGRTNDPPWYGYTLSATPFSWEAEPQPMNHSDLRHIKTAG